MAFDPKSCMFICDNLAVSSANALNDGGRFPMIATPADPTFYRCVTKRGRAMDIYEIREAPQGNIKGKQDVFMGYWCPYEQNRTSYTTLTGLADYMFTATMDGCTFGIGQPGSDGTVLVSHANSAKDDTPKSHAPMITAQKAGIRSRLGSKSKLFQPSDYRKRGFLNVKSDVSAMTFGVWSGKTWQFYAHRFRKVYEGIAIKYIHYETVKIK